jgi:hypothetical protein
MAKKTEVLSWCQVFFCANFWPNCQVNCQVLFGMWDVLDPMGWPENPELSRVSNEAEVNIYNNNGGIR